MKPFVKLTKASFKDGQTIRHDPVWINPWGVNAVEPCKDGQATWVRMDDGLGYIVAETPRTVVGRLNRVMESTEWWREMS